MWELGARVNNCQWGQRIGIDVITWFMYKMSATHHYWHYSFVLISPVNPSSGDEQLTASLGKVHLGFKEASRKTMNPNGYALLQSNVIAIKCIIMPRNDNDNSNDAYLIIKNIWKEFIPPLRNVGTGGTCK